jgi:dolichol-phosphate mannosyltransferase
LAVALSIPLSFAKSQTIAVVVAMTSNFVLNNHLSRQATIGIAAYTYSEKPVWWLAGLAGAVVGAVWNYALSSFFTWKR